LNQLAIFELSLGLPGWELDQSDKIFMDVSIDARPAFLENALVDYCFTIASHHKQGKRPLYAAMRTQLPEQITMRDKIPSLSTPQAFYRSKWFQEKMQTLLQDRYALWNVDLLKKFMTSERAISGDMLYRLIYIESWLDNFERLNGELLEVAA
jgi:hypothetical protein